tara:strand:+ start:60 stop:296 length:237 start_codon:yes stop_codon:yes gene_type:complete
MLRYSVFLVQISSAWTGFRADSLLLTGTRAKNVQMIELVLTRGADIQALDDNGVGAAEWASREGHISLSETLRASGAR